MFQSKPLLARKSAFPGEHLPEPVPAQRLTASGVEPTRTSTTVEVGASESIPARTKESMPNNEQRTASLIVGAEVKLRGAEIQDCDTLIVEGRVEATMDSRVLRIAEKGSFAGKVAIDMADIRGVFEGELTAREQLTIRTGARVSGKIRYGSLLVEAGGVISGDVGALSTEAATASSISNIKPLVVTATG